MRLCSDGCLKGLADCEWRYGSCVESVDLVSVFENGICATGTHGMIRWGYWEFLGEAGSDRIRSNPTPWVPNWRNGKVFAVLSGDREFKFSLLHKRSRVENPREQNWQRSMGGTDGGTLSLVNQIDASQTWALDALWCSVSSSLKRCGVSDVSQKKHVLTFTFPVGSVASVW